MSNAGSAYIEILPRLNKAAFAKAGSEIEGALGKGDPGKSIGEKYGQGIAAGLTASIATAAIPAIMGLGRELIKTASHTELMAQKADVVFGRGQAQKIRQWGDEVGRSLGLSQSQAVAAASSFQDFLVPMGMARETGAEMSTQLVELAGALALTDEQGRSTTEISQLLTGALAGEYDAIQRLGMPITAATVKQQMMAEAQQGLKFASEDAAKAHATYTLMLQASQDTMTLAAQSGDTLAVKQRQAAAAFQEVKESVAAALLPALTQLMEVAVPVLSAIEPLAPALAAVGVATAGWYGVKQGAEWLEGLGMSAKGLTGTLAVATPFLVALGLSWGAGNLIMEITGKTEGLAEATERLQTAIGEGNPALDSFISVADKAPTAMAPWSVAMDLATQDVYNLGNGVKVTNHDVRYALDQLNDADLMGLRNELYGARAATEEGSKAYEGYSGIIAMVEERTGGLGVGLGAMAAQQYAANEAANEATSSAGSSTSAYAMFAGALAGAATEAKSLLDTLDQLWGNQRSLEEATAGYEAAIDALTESITANGNTLDYSTEAGRKNVDAIQSRIDATNSMMAAEIANGVSVQDATNRHNLRIEALRQELLATGMNAAEVDALTQRYLQVPPDVMTQATFDAAKAMIDGGNLIGLAQIYDAMSPEAKAELNKYAAEKGISDLNGQLNALNGKTVTTYVVTQFEERYNTRGVTSERTAERQGRAPANGVVYFGKGGFHTIGKEEHIAQIAPAGAYRVWAEDETGGEAYIPLAPSKRDRSLKIWEETGRRLGVMADGGVLGGAMKLPTGQNVFNVYFTMDDIEDIHSAVDFVKRIEVEARTQF